jgi:hypothetical protein
MLKVFLRLDYVDETLLAQDEVKCQGSIIMAMNHLDPQLSFSLFF